jgi:hypothetical protein
MRIDTLQVMSPKKFVSPRFGFKNETEDYVSEVASVYDDEAQTQCKICE